MSTACPKCGSRHLRPSRTRSLAEDFKVLRLVSPLRCQDCSLRFFAPIIVWTDLFYARCPNCLRMDLNGWTGRAYANPSMWIAFKIVCGAKRLRCEYCRLNFASFRKRKEPFTFKRWRKFVRPAEQAPQPVRDVDAPDENADAGSEPVLQEKARKASA
jgi:hypothetical protein